MSPNKRIFSFLTITCSIFLSFNAAFAMDGPPTFSLVGYSDANHLKRWETLIEQSKKHFDGEHKIALITNVLPDGLGDLFLCLRAFQSIKTKYPNADIRLIIFTRVERVLPDFSVFGLSEEQYLLIPKQRHMRDPTPHLKLEILEDRIFGRYSGALHDQEYAEFAKRVDDFLTFVRSVDLTLEMSTQTSDYAAMQMLPTSQDKYGFFPEYDLERVRCPYEEIIFRMGLGPRCFGIFIPKPNLKDRFADAFLEELFKTEVYFNYGGKVDEYAAFIKNLNKDVREITIITNLSINQIKEKTFIGFSKILYAEKNSDEHCLFESDNDGPTLKLVNAFPIAHDDMLLAIKRSQTPVGVTGNNTFSEAVSLRKLPYYNAVVATKSFWENLKKLAQFALPGRDLLHSYLEQLTLHKGPAQIAASELAMLETQWLELVSLLTTKFDIDTALLGKVNTAIEVKK